MSLRAWYPLNGDIKDYSGNEFHLNDISNIPIYEHGKIGKTYNFNTGKPFGYENAILTMGKTYKNLTATAWICPTEYPTEHGNNIFSFGGNTVIRARLQPTKKLWVIWGGVDGTGYQATVSVQEIPLNKWTHVTFRLREGKMSIYINGIKDSESTHVNDIIMNSSKFYIGNYNVVSTEAWKGYLNDIRIYDEALTGMQIKEIAQTKLLHYTLNEKIEPRKNLCKQYPIRKVSSTNSPYTGTIFGSDKIGDYFIKTATSYRWDGIAINNIPMKPNVYYTVSFELLSDQNFYVMYDNNTTASNMTGNDAPRLEEVSLFGRHYDTPGSWKKFAMRSIIKPEAENTKLHDVIAAYHPENTDMIGRKVYYKNIMVEEKDRSANYIENEKSITIVNKADYLPNLNIEASKSHDYPKAQNEAYLFSKYSQITTNFKITDNYIANDNAQLTFSVWLKPTVALQSTEYGMILGRAHFEGFGIIQAYHDASNIKVATYHRLTDSNITTKHIPIKINEWAHIVAVLDKSISKIKLYINGIKASEVPCSTGRSSVIDRTIYLGGEQFPYGSGPFAAYQGYMKDFRVYATALSDSDIKLLYNKETTIDKANVIRCSEINEMDKVIQEKVHIISVGYGTYQNDYKLQIGDRLSYTYRDVQVGWTITEITKNNEIINNSFRTHGNDARFILLKQYVENIPTTSTILISTYDQASGPHSTGDATSSPNCVTWINYLRSLGATKISTNFAYRSSYIAVIQGKKIMTEVIDNIGTNSKAELNTTINLTLEQKGFNKDASIHYEEFSEIPNIESGIHNLKLGNETLPVLVDMDNDGGMWARVFYHNCKNGTVLFSNLNSHAEAKETNKTLPVTSDKYSILSKLESFRTSNKSPFEFRLRYPSDTNVQKKWLVRQYDNIDLGSAENYPEFKHIENKVPTSERFIDDTMELYPTANVKNNFIVHYSTNVYCSTDKTITIGASSDDGSTFYVNDIIQHKFKNTNPTTTADFTLTFKAGWNKLDILYYEHAGNELLLFNALLSSKVTALNYNKDIEQKNIWRQLSNPTFEKIRGYKPVNISWTSNNWGGIEIGSPNCLAKGSASVNFWYYAIGASTIYSGGIPSSNNVHQNGSTVNDVELWVKINDLSLFENISIDNVSIDKDGVITATEFREI